ncbi:hypothetical protein B0H16DRAFT_1485747 [Mycena metata]|uniref:Uncharacterized protein n=1 Tax=Mycena metata TaxID=1033252 RepID=A0AAD7DLT6_9AGAR|nr:hypothetical protein B0H16DRAFT_1485747 [Mycena metata]
MFVLVCPNTDRIIQTLYHVACFAGEDHSFPVQPLVPLIGPRIDLLASSRSSLWLSFVPPNRVLRLDRLVLKSANNSQMAAYSVIHRFSVPHKGCHRPALCGSDGRDDLKAAHLTQHSGSRITAAAAEELCCVDAALLDFGCVGLHRAVGLACNVAERPGLLERRPSRVKANRNSGRTDINGYLLDGREGGYRQRREGPRN